MLLGSCFPFSFLKDIMCVSSENVSLLIQIWPCGCIQLPFITPLSIYFKFLHIPNSISECIFKAKIGIPTYVLVETILTSEEAFVGHDLLPLPHDRTLQSGTQGPPAYYLPMRLSRRE